MGLFEKFTFVISWLPILEKEIKNLKDPNKNFRLFLTSEPHAKFSTILLQTCTKITYEAPPGIKKNMERIYQIWSNSLFKEINTNESELVLQTLFAMALIHAILQERRTYIPQGWSKFYEFSYSDLKVSAETIVEYLKQYDSQKVWKNIQGLVINSFFGGRIDNDFDFKVMMTYIIKILNRNILTNSNQKILNKFPVLMSKNLKSYIDLISSIPDVDEPGIFGLPQNVDRSVQRYTSAQVILKLNNIYSISSDSFKFDKTLVGEKLLPIFNMWKSIYTQDIVDSISRTAIKIINTEDPLKIFIKSEASHIYELILAVEKTFNEISQSLFSNGLITSNILKNCNSLLQNQIPDAWIKLWEGPELPLNYIKSLSKKITGVISYVNYAINDNLLENPLNLADFIHPDAFISALRQNSARRNKIPIDQLELACDFSNTRKDPNIIVAKISGLFLQGSDLEGGQLIDSSGDKSEIIALPSMNLYWVEKKSMIFSEKEMVIFILINYFYNFRRYPSMKISLENGLFVS